MSVRLEPDGTVRVWADQASEVLFQAEFDSPPPPPNHTILPSGIIVMGIDSWVARFEMSFEKTSIYFTT